MSKSDDYLLKAAKASTLRKQGDFVEAAITAWRARGESKPGNSRKADAFTFLREFYKQTGQYPKIYAASKHLREKLGLSKPGADQFVRFFLLWECRSYGRLSEQDTQWIAKTFPQVWKPHQKRAKLVESHFAAVRAAEREIARLRAAAAPTTPQPAAAPSSSRRTTFVTREWLIKKGFL